MIQHFGEINGVIKGMGAIVDNQKPFVQVLVNNWPLTIIAGCVLFARARQLHKTKQLSTFTFAKDAGIVLAPLIAIGYLNHLSKQAAPARPAATANDLRESSNSPVPGT
jgi:hypothetical protein